MRYGDLVRRTGLCAAGAVVAVSFSLDAATAQQPTLPGVSSEYSIGVLNGKAQEFVYNPGGSTLSRLDWRMDNVPMLNAGTQVRLLPWLMVGLKGSINIDGSGTLDDFDFDTGFCPPSTPGHDMCHSNSSAKLRRASMLDMFASADFFRAGGFAASALAGYKSDEYRWQAFGGTANYGTLPPGLGISYAQRWSAPFLGVGLAGQWGALSLNGRVIASAWATGDDSDGHHLRSLLFFDDFGTTRMVSGEVGLAYRVNPYLSLTADYRYLNWGVGKGPTTEHDLAGGGTTVFSGDASGGNNVSQAVSLGVKVDLAPAVGPPVSGLKDVPIQAPVSWAGWSFGATSGVAWQGDNWKTTGLTSLALAPAATTASAGFDGIGEHAGIFLGYSRRAGDFVLGVEGDLGKSNTSAIKVGIPGTATAPALAASPDAAVVSAGYDGSVRLRAGLLLAPAFQAYLTGGLALQEIEASASCAVFAGPPSSPWCVASRHQGVSKTAWGWTVGAGYEWAFAGGWFTRGEYRYTSLGDVDVNFFANAPIDTVLAKIEPSNQRLTFALGYRF